MDAVEKVAQFPQREDKVFNVEWTVNIGKDRQARVLTDFPQGGDPAKFNERLDMIDAALTRQKARHELVELEEKLEQAEEQCEQWQADHDEAERDHLKKIAAAEAKANEAKARHDETERNDRQLHARSDKRGEWAAKGTVKQAIDRYVNIEANATAERQNLEAERDLALNNLKVNLKGQKKLIARIKKMIEQKKAVLGAGA